MTPSVGTPAGQDAPLADRCLAMADVLWRGFGKFKGPTAGDIRACELLREAAAALTRTPSPSDAVRQAMQSTRGEFEAWVMNWFGKGPMPGALDQPAEFWLARNDDGRYEVTRIDDAWTGWQARAALASSTVAQVEPVLPVAQDGEAEFVKWFKASYPVDCVMHDPAWHAPRLYRSALAHAHPPVRDSNTGEE